MLGTLIIGCLCGFFGSVPILGPTGIIIFENGLRGHRSRAIAISIGSALAESLYALLAFWGLATMIQRHPLLLPIARGIGAIIIIALGLFLAFRRESKKAPEKEPKTDGPLDRGGPLLFGFAITVINPTILASWAAVIAALHSTSLLRVQPNDALPFAVGIGVGIVSWFTVLVALLARVQNKFKAGTIDRVLRVTGCVLILVGIGLGARVL